MVDSTNLGPEARQMEGLEGGKTGGREGLEGGKAGGRD